jgi:CubicO group peptidase (beta-lactamase class C family)
METQPRPALTSEWLTALRAAMRAEHVPNVAVGVVRGDGTIVDTVVSSGAQAATDGGIFEAASLTKPVFAALVMSLVRDGVIRLDAPLSTYPGWPRMSDPRAEAITAAMVLSHSSGLGNDDADSGKRLAFDPGHGWRYSGAGYRYVQRVIEHVTGQSLDELLRTRIFAPLGMERTTVVDAARPGFPWFVGHDRAGRPMPPDRFARASASTSLRTTARDYARFLLAVMDGGRDGSPLRRADVAAMLDPRVFVDSSLGIRWGLGWALAGPVLFHWGSNPGFKSFVFADRSRHVGVVMLTDGDNGLELAPRLVRAATGRDYAFLRFYMLHPTD